ncbi:MAG: DUF4835 family protein [Ignavibacteria bacterium]|nr:DUF4835 family protein [Ignavibacteria bacterium]
MKIQNTIKFGLLLIIITFLGLNNKLHAQTYQDLNATVIIEDQALPTDARERLRNFKQQVQDYLNRNKWHDEPIPTINCTFQFNFRTTNGFDLYETQLVVVAQREVYRRDKTEPVRYTTMFRILDERCNFSYQSSMQFIKNDVIFDPLLSLLNYYAYLIVGYDEDSYYPKGGTKYFQKALDICNKLITDKRGWTETGGGSKPSRLQIVQELTNVKFDDYRKGFFEYHWMGLDSLGINKNNAYQYIVKSLEKMSNIRKKEIRAYNIDIFFDTKYLEIADTFLDYGDKSVYDKFITFDPTHRTTYEEKKRLAR